MFKFKGCFSVDPRFGTVDRLYGDCVFEKAVVELHKINLSLVTGKIPLLELHKGISDWYKDLVLALPGDNLFSPDTMDSICDTLKCASKDYDRWKWDVVAQMQDTDNAFYHTIEPFRNLWKEIISESRADYPVMDYVLDVFSKKFADTFMIEFADTIDTFRLFRKEPEKVMCKIKVENEGLFFIVELTVEP